LVDSLASTADCLDRPGDRWRADGLGAGVLGGAHWPQTIDQTVPRGPAAGPAPALRALAPVAVATGAGAVCRLVQLDAGTGRTGLLATGIVQRRRRP